MTELLLLCPLLAGCLCQGFTQSRRWLLTVLASVLGLFPVLLSGLALLEGTLPSLSVSLPSLTSSTAFLSFGGDFFSLLLVTVVNIGFWSLFLYFLLERKIPPTQLSAVAFLQFFIVGLILSRTPLTLSLFWIGSALPHYFLTVRSARVHHPLKPLATSLLSIGCFAAAMAGIYPDLTVPFSSTPAVGAVTQAHPILLWTLLVASLCRLGIWPFQSWISWTTLHCHPIVGAALCLLFPLTGVMPFVLFVPHLPPSSQSALLGLSLLSVFYLSLCSIGEREIYRFLGYVRGAILSLFLILLSIHAPVDGLGVLIGTQTLALFSLFLFFSGLTRDPSQSWVWKPDGSPGFQGVWQRYQVEALVAAGIIIAGLSVPSLTSLNPDLELWGTLRRLPTASLFVVALSIFVLSMAILEKYRAIFLTPGSQSPPLSLPVFSLAPSLSVLLLTSVLAVASLFLGGT